MSSALPADRERDATSHPAVLAVLACVAAGIAGYLLTVALGHQGLPVGCGEEGGCAEVLTSRWSSVWGVPVSGLALPLYLALAAAAAWPQARGSGTVLRFGSVVLVLAAGWFLGLQAFVLGAFCPWCVAEHVLGLVIAPWAWRVAARNQRGRVDHRPVDQGPVDHRSVDHRPVALAGLASVVGLAALQILGPLPHTTIRLADSLSEATADRVTLLQGGLQLDPRDEPRLGEVSARHSLYVMFDYCCPHCRRTHDYLTHLMAERPGELSVVCLPTPRDADCNPEITETESRFDDACELATLALGVWTVDPAAFGEFDRWLFESARPPTLADARARAEQLVDPAALDGALSGPESRERIARNVAAYNASPAEYLPVLMAPGMDPIVGRPESQDALWTLLRRDLFQLPE